MIKKSFEILVILIITAVIMEVGLRIFNKFNPNFIFPNNTYNRFRGQPFTPDYNFKLNSKGFKDIEYPEEKEKNVFRILGIGDSMTYGVVPYEHNFLTLIEDKLNKGNRRFEIINMGIPCIGVDSYHALLVNEGLKLNPDLVICCFFMGNDIIEELKQEKISYLIYFLKVVFKIFPKYAEVVSENVWYGNTKYKDEDPSPILSRTDFVKHEQFRSTFFLKDYSVIPKCKTLPEQLDYVVSYLKKMNGLCKSKNIKFLVVMIPDELQVDPALQKEIISTIKSKNLGMYDFKLPNKLLHLQFELLDIEYLDLLDDFIAATRSKKYYKKYDTHWNIAGNKFAADLIYKKLKY